MSSSSLPRICDIGASIIVRISDGRMAGRHAGEQTAVGDKYNDLSRVVTSRNQTHGRNDLFNRYSRIR